MAPANSAPHRLTKGERTRQRLLDAAVREFGQHGYRATSVSRLSRAADLTPAAAYAYFADKQAFWQAAVLADLQAVEDGIRARMKSAERPLVEFVFALVEGLSTHPLSRRVLAEGSPADVKLFMGHPLFQRTTEMLTLALRRRHEAGLMPPGADPDLIARGIETVLIAFVLAMVRSGLESDAERVDAVVALVQAAVGGPPVQSERPGGS